MLGVSAEVAETSFYVLGSAALLAHLLSMLKSYMKIREMRIKALAQRLKQSAPLYHAKMRLTSAALHKVNRPSRK